MNPNEEQSTREIRTDKVESGDATVEKQTVRETSTTSGVVIAQRIVWYIVGVIVALLLLRLILQLLGANTGNAFVDLIYTLSGVFAAPFFGMFSYEPSYGVVFFEVSTAVAIVVYPLIGWGLAKLFALGSANPQV